MLDPRISLAVQAPNIAPAINIFENALMNAQTRDVRGQQAAQQALLNPLQIQQAQQGLDINQQALDSGQAARDQQALLNPLKLQQSQQAIDLNVQQLAAGKVQQELQIENRILRSIAEFGTKLKPVIESGNVEQAQAMLNTRLLELQEQKLPTDVTLDAIAALESGDTKSVISAIDSAQTIARQRGLLGASQVSVGQREFNSNVAAVKADPKLKTVEGKAAAVALGIEARAVGSSAQTVALNDELTQKVADSKAKIRQSEKFGELTASSRSKAIDKGFDQITKIDLGLSNIDDAIQAVTDGAGTGFIDKNFPSIKAASVLLDNIQGRMALDVIGAVTFGALSKGELDLAKMIALPTGLEGPELIKHLQDKKAAQQKLRNYYGEQIEFLDQGGSVAGFLRSKKRGLSSASPSQPEVTSQFTEGQTATGPNGEKITFQNGQWVGL